MEHGGPILSYEKILIKSSVGMIRVDTDWKDVIEPGTPMYLDHTTGKVTPKLTSLLIGNYYPRMESEMKARRITVEQYIDLGTWCKCYRDDIERIEHTQLEACALASKDLGFEVPLSAMQRVAKKMKVKWANAKPEPLPVPLDREAIIILMGAIAGLYVELGKTVPDNLANLHSTYVKE